MFDPVSNKIKFPEQEEEILHFWEEQNIFKQSLELRKDEKEYVFYDGPPFATGLPHYGHLLAGTIKDIVPRYHTMRGHYVARRFGWDCHGLPIEALAQEALGLAGSADILERGVDVFNEQCRSMVLTYVEEWRKTVTRMGRWVDFEDDYKTMDVTFMETIWWVFQQLWNKDRIYKAHRIMPYSWKLTTPLSNFEANRNYQDVQDPAITVRMKLVKAKAGFDVPAYFLAWTTTPWTLPANLAVCVGPDIDYVAVKDIKENCIYVMAEARLSAYYKKPEDYEKVGSFKGTDLAGWRYEPLFNYFENHPASFVALVDPFVTTEDGTGIVHLAPAYGEDDYRVCREAGIELVDPLDADCKFTGEVPDFEGRFCKEADKDLIRKLKQEGRLVHQSTIMHSYPFCERTDTPLVYRAIDAWYVKVEDLHEKLVANNEQIHWMPEYVGSKRFGNWLQDAKDWNISRNRFWGSCIPVWVSEDGSDSICVGSIAELEELSGQKVDDLHKHVVDQVTFEKDGKTYRRTPEVLDCWFESGAMPYAQLHYPFENQARFESHFPADFIAEGLDQTRGWFYTLMVLSTTLFEKPAFNNVVVNGLVLAEDGRKMSKRLKNYPDPMDVLHAYGADALRLYLINSPVVRAEDLCFSEEGVKHVLRSLLIPLWNAYSFFITYARIDEWHPSTHMVDTRSSSNLLDRWILSSLEKLTGEVMTAMDQYNLQASVRPFTHFIEDLTNWYIRRSRRRFWKSSDDEDKQQAYETLYQVLLRLSKIAAPFVPFISEAMYRNLCAGDMQESVHLCDFPESDESERDRELEAQMNLVQSVVSMGRTLRSDYDLKVRQPLKGIHIAARDQQVLANIDELQSLICDELNLKEAWFNDSADALATMTAKPNLPNLGPRLGARLKEIRPLIENLEQSQLEALASGEAVTLSLESGSFDLGPDDVLIEHVPREGLAVASQGTVVVALETELTEELILEGLAREFVNKVQNMRKNQGLEVTQRIEIQYQGDEKIAGAVSQFVDYIQAETLATACVPGNGSNEAVEWDLNGHKCCIDIGLATRGSAS